MKKLAKTFHKQNKKLFPLTHTYLNTNSDFQTMLHTYEVVESWSLIMKRWTLITNSYNIEAYSKYISYENHNLILPVRTTQIILIQNQGQRNTL